jgi:hypothetical protein
MSHTAVANFVVRCPLLECFQLKGRSAEELSTILQNCGGTLLFLSLSGLQFMDTDALVAVTQHCLNLRELELCGCEGTSVACLVQLVSSLPLVRHLLLTRSSTITDAVLIAVSKHMPKLESFNLYGSTGYTQEGALVLIRSLLHLRKFTVQKDHSIFSVIVLGVWKDRLPCLKICKDNCGTPGCCKLYGWW